MQQEHRNTGGRPIKKTAEYYPFPANFFTTYPGRNFCSLCGADGVLTLVQFFGMLCAEPDQRYKVEPDFWVPLSLDILQRKDVEGLQKIIAQAQRFNLLAYDESTGVITSPYLNEILEPLHNRRNSDRARKQQPAPEQQQISNNQHNHTAQQPAPAVTLQDGGQVFTDFDQLYQKMRTAPGWYETAFQPAGLSRSRFDQLLVDYIAHLKKSQHGQGKTLADGIKHFAAWYKKQPEVVKVNYTGPERPRLDAQT